MMQFSKHIFGYVLISLCLALLVVIAPIVNAQSNDSEPGLGYSEGPFELIENPMSAIGDSPLAAMQASAANTEVMTADGMFTETYQDVEYAFIAVTADDIGNTAIVTKSGDAWRFVCREAGLMPSFRMVENCSVPEAIAPQLEQGLIDELTNSPRR
jgi:hypothetical protein